VSKSLIRRRRESGAVCFVCRSPDYRIEPNEIPGFKPNIICNSCGNLWQDGHDGGVYAALVTRDAKVGPVD
jgi:hypothetical protein